MITNEEYDLNYTLYLADRDLNEATYDQQLKALSESGNLQVLNEGKIGDTIKKYLEKIVSGIQAAWNKFKENIYNTRMKYREDDIQKMINDYEPHIQVENYVTYNTRLLNDAVVKELTTQMLDSEDLDSKDAFMSRYYSNIYTTANTPNANDTSIYVTLKDHVTSGAPNTTHDITKDDLQTMFDFMKAHKENMGNIQKDLDEINDSVKMATQEADMLDQMEQNASNAAQNTVTPPNTNETNAGNGGRTATANEAYIREADDDPKPKIVSDNTDNGGGEGGDSNGESQAQKMKKRIQVFFSASTQLISAKMKLNREIFFFYSSVVEKHMANCLADNKANKNDNAAPQVQAGGENNEGNNNGGPEVTP